MSIGYEQYLKFSPSNNMKYERFETYTWINKSIESCINPNQLAACRFLISRFNIMYNDYDLTENLRWYVNQKTRSFLNKNKLNDNCECDCHKKKLIQNHKINKMEHPNDYD
jgi:hypothetical protein